jgi:fatty acid desaturase
MAYHVEHHLYPSVPVFRLKKLHNLLRERNPNYDAQVHVADGFQLVEELTRA